MKKKYAPIAIYTYTRFDFLKSAIRTLRDCPEASASDLFIVSDAANRKEDERFVSDIRDYVSDIKGFGSVNLIKRISNLGSFESITQAETQIISDYGKIIALEDDNLVSRNFLKFINSGLDFYENNDSVFSICGYSPDLTLPTDYNQDFWVAPWHIPWGYGFWKDKYLAFDNKKNLYEKIIKNKKEIKRLKSYGLFAYDSIYLDWKGISPVYDAKVNSHTFTHNMFSIAPTKSLVKNIGHDGSGENAKVGNYFDVEVDDVLKESYGFSNDVFINPQILYEYTNFMDKGVLGKLIKVLGFRRAFYFIKKRTNDLNKKF